MKILKLLNIFFFLAMMICIVYSCKKTKTNDLNNNQVSNILIGDSLEGGIVGYILQAGDAGYSSTETHGLIVTNQDNYFGYYGCNEVNISGAKGTSIGSGKQNTLDLINSCSEPKNWASICNNLVLNGYDDWHMPSKDELSKLVMNRKAIGGMFVGIPPYASSSIIDSISCCGWGYNNDDTLIKVDRVVFFKVRPVRVF